MSDWYEAVAVQDVVPINAAFLAQRVVESLAGQGIIQSVVDPESVLGGEVGYRPGPRIPEMYQRCGAEGEFWDLITNGMEPCVGRWVNDLGFTCFDGFTCRKCKRRFAPDDDLVANPFAEAIGQFVSGVDDPSVACPNCGVTLSVRRWQTNPHFGFVNLAFKFWNWPPLGSSPWQVNVPDLIKEPTGHEIILTYGRL